VRNSELEQRLADMASWSKCDASGVVPAERLQRRRRKRQMQGLGCHSAFGVYRVSYFGPIDNEQRNNVAKTVALKQRVVKM
jgi:hypothetical protein